MVCLLAGVAVIMFPLDVEFCAKDFRFDLHQKARAAATLDGPTQFGVEAHRLCLRVVRKLFVESVDIAATKLSSSFYPRLVLQVAIHLVAVLLPVLLQAACRGEVAGVMHQLQLLEDAAVGQYIHDGEEPV